MPSHDKLSDFKVENLLQDVKRQDAHAMYILAHKYIYAEEVERDGDKAINLLKKSYKAGNLNAMRALGYIYSQESFGHHNCEKAISLLMSTAKNGDNKSKHYLAVMYIYGVCVKKDYKKAYKLLGEAYNNGHHLSGVVRHHIVSINSLGLLKYFLKPFVGINLYVISMFHFFKGDLGENDRLWNLTTFRSLKEIGVFKRAKEKANTERDLF